MDAPLEQDYFEELVQAFIRGRLGAEVKGLDGAELIARGRSAGLRLNKFKRSVLPRVVKALGILRGLDPDDLLDIGSGRGTFLWPFVDAFPEIPVTALDISERRVIDINAVHTGGIGRVTAHCQDVETMDPETFSADVVTALEVMEHLHRPEAAAANLLACAGRFILVSVPSKPDDNPEHLRLYTPDSLRNLWLNAGATSVRIDHVHNHMLAVVKR